MSIPRLGRQASNMKNEFIRNGLFLHDDPRDRPMEIYGGRTTIYLGGGRQGFALLLIIPQRSATKATEPKATKPAQRKPTPSKMKAKSKRRR